MTDAAKHEHEQLYQMYMNGQHRGDSVIKEAFDWWIQKVTADIDGWSAKYGTDPESLRVAIDHAISIERSSGPSNAAAPLYKFFWRLIEHAPGDS